MPQICPAHKVNIAYWPLKSNYNPVKVIIGPFILSWDDYNGRCTGRHPASLISSYSLKGKINQDL